MNKLSNYFLLLFISAGFLFLASCGEDTETPSPNTAVSFADTTAIVASPGDTIDITVNGIGVDSIEVLANPSVDFEGSNTIAPGGSVQIIIPVSTAAGTNIVLTASATDANANAQRTIIITFDNLIEALTQDSEDRFTILADAVQEAGLLATIQDAEALTIFAPTNDAFAELGIDGETDLSTVPDLDSILLYHVLGSEVLAEAVSEEGQDVETLSGQSIYAVRDGETVRINGIQVTDADIVAGNGVVHVVDKVLFPISWSATLLSAPTSDQSSETFFSTRTGEAYSVNDVTSSEDIISAFVDFGYGWGPQNGASLEAADSYTRYNLENEGWATLNNVDFRTTNLSVDDFNSRNAAIPSEISGDYETGTALTNPGQITGLEEGDIIAFTTGDGRFGLIHVVEIEPGIESNDFIRIEVKVTN